MLHIEKKPKKFVQRFKYKDSENFYTMSDPFGTVNWQ
jgi:hypothetical protein